MRRLAGVLLLLLLAPSLFAATGFQANGAFLALSVSDLDASVAWYRDKLGLEVQDRPAAPEAIRVAILQGGGFILELIQHKDAKAGLAKDAYLQHGIFKAGVIVDDFDGLVAMLREKKVEIAYGPYPAKEKMRANLIVRDNSGNLIQFFARR